MKEREGKKLWWWWMFFSFFMLGSILNNSCHCYNGHLIRDFLEHGLIQEWPTIWAVQIIGLLDWFHLLKWYQLSIWDPGLAMKEDAHSSYHIPQPITWHACLGTFNMSNWHDSYKWYFCGTINTHWLMSHGSIWFSSPMGPTPSRPHRPMLDLIESS